MTLTIGQSLTPEQVRELPDGAIFTIGFGERGHIDTITVGSIVDGRFYTRYNCFTVGDLNSWGPKGWHSATLVSLPTEPTPCASSEIGREAAVALIEKTVDEIEKRASSYAAYRSLDTLNILMEEARRLLSAYEHARSIGAIE